MPELIAAYWPYILIAFLIGLAVAWFAFASNRKTAIIREEGAARDVLDEGAERARRNEALLKAAPAAGPLSSAANASEVAHVTADTDAEAGAAVAPTMPTETVQAAAAQEAAEGEGEGDDLTRIKGLGPKIAALLAEQGVTRFEQIANWSDADIDRVDATLGRFEGRIRRDSWVEQARLLAAGDESGFAQQYGNSQSD